jgi:hypothetical protein
MKKKMAKFCFDLTQWNDPFCWRKLEREDPQKAVMTLSVIQLIQKFMTGKKNKNTMPLAGWWAVKAIVMVTQMDTLMVNQVALPVK